MFGHFADVFVLCTTWNDLFCSCVGDVSIWLQMFNLSHYLWSAGSNLMPGYLEHILQAQWLWIIEKWLQKRKVTFSDDVLTVVDFRLCSSSLLGCLRNDDVKGNDNATQINDLISWMRRKKNYAARAARFLLQFFSGYEDNASPQQ